MIELAKMAIGGISSWFTTSQELKKVKEAGKIEIEKAKTIAEVTRIDKESTQDHDYNMAMVKRMDMSWKDEFVLIVVSIPMSLEYYRGGFEALDKLPAWYQILVLGIFFSIYGLKDIFKVVLQLLLKGKSK